MSRAIRIAAKAVFALADPFFGKLPGPRILIYHQVGTDLGREMEVSTKAFRRQLDWLQAHGEIVDLETAIERWDEPDADKLFVLTFDDGFEDVYHNAFPLMKERGIPFTLYLTTSPIETGQPLDPRYPAAKPLTWDQVNEMIGTGLVTVGAHTHTHPDLRKLSAEAIADELDTSNRLIWERTGVCPKHFTYPWGWWSEAAHTLVRERYASATLADVAPAAPFDCWRMIRTPVQYADIRPFFTRKLQGGMQAESALRSAAVARKQMRSSPGTNVVQTSESLPLIVHVIDSLTSTGGAEKRFVEEILSMSGLSHVVVRLYERDELDVALRAGGIPVIHLGLESTRSATQLLLGVGRLRSIVMRLRPFAVHSSLFAANLVAQAATATVQPTIPVLSTLTRVEDKRVEGVLFNRGSRGWRRSAVAWLGSKARRLPHVRHRAVGQAVRDSAITYLRLDPNGIEVIPRGVQLEGVESRSSVSRSVLGLPEGQLILNVGRLSAPKGQVHLIRAFAQVIHVIPTAQLAIAGDSQDAAHDVRAEISALGLSGSVHLLGHRDDVPELLSVADVVCQPSLSEGLPGVVLESLALGRPVVAFDIPAMREIDESASGIELVPLGDQEALAKGLLRILGDQEYATELAARGRQSVARFEAARVAGDLESLLLEVGSRTRSRDAVVS